MLKGRNTRRQVIGKDVHRTHELAVVVDQHWSGKAWVLRKKLQSAICSFILLLQLSVSKKINFNELILRLGDLQKSQYAPRLTF